MCNNKDFTHLHVHSHFSVQDALPSPTELANAANDLGFRAIALTDHGRMSGSVEFVDACRKTENNVKGIIGLEVYTCQDMMDKTRRVKHNHLTLLAKNYTGYQNLLKISSIASEIGYYYNPRVDHSVLEKHSEGIIALSGCLASEVNQALMKDDYDEAKRVAEKLRNTFEDFYVELQYHGTKNYSMDEQKKNTPLLIQIAKELDLPLVASNDVHYIYNEDWEAHDVLFRLQNLREDKKQKGLTGKQLAYGSHQFYMKSAEQMMKIFGYIAPESISNSVLISEMCEDFLPLDVAPLLPKAHIPEKDTIFLSFKENNLKHHQDNDAYLAYLAFEGLKKLGLDENKIYVNRLKKELSQIWYMGVTDYFLIQNEMVEYLKKENILYGIRGSGVASLVNYCLEISSIDPIKFNLMFERFLNPGRGTQYDFKFEDSDKLNIEEIENEIAIKQLRNLVKEKITLIKDYDTIQSNILKELWVIENQELSSYYLHLYNHKFKYNHNNINSWTAYALGITDIIPSGELKVKKFATLPDVDTDVDDSKKPQVIGWLKERFGYENVVQIGAWGKYAARAAVKGALKTSDEFNDLQDKKGLTVEVEVNKITSSIPFRPGTTISSAIQDSPEFASYSKKWAKEISNAKLIEGKIANLGVHAAGVIVSSEPINLHAPIEKSKDSICSGFDWADAERVGLIKFDILGLTTMRIFDICFNFIKQRHDKVVNFKTVVDDLPEVYDIFKNGDTSNIFQFGGDGMKKTLKQIKASTMEDLIAVVSLYRPGPMDYISDFANRKFNKTPYRFDHEITEKHLASTYGIIVYQEQAMYIVKEMAGLSWTETDKLRKAISKKSGKDFDYMCNLFRTRAEKKEIPNYIIENVLQLMQKFVGYAFNRAHAASYANLAYQSAYFQHNYPIEWYAANIEAEINGNNKPDKDEQINKCIQEAMNKNINVYLPDVNLSEMHVTINNKNEIILPLTYCKGIGDNGGEMVALNKPYSNIEDFIIRARPNKTVFTALAKIGALSEIGMDDDMLEEELTEYFIEINKKFKKMSKINNTKITNKSTIKTSWSSEVDSLFEGL